jgi:hypothetical protein
VNEPTQQKPKYNTVNHWPVKRVPLFEFSQLKKNKKNKKKNNKQTNIIKKKEKDKKKKN